MNIFAKLFSNKLHEQNAKLQKELDDLKRSISVKSREASVVVDFAEMNVVSIERMDDNNTDTDIGPYTIIGYKIGTPEQFTIEEWTVYCSDENHEKLVQDFIKFQSEQ